MVFRAVEDTFKMIPLAFLLALTWHEKALGVQVGVKSPLGLVIGVGNAVPDPRPLSCD